MIHSRWCRLWAGALACGICIASPSRNTNVRAADEDVRTPTYDAPSGLSASAQLENVGAESGSGGTVTFHFDAAVLDGLGLGFIAHGQLDEVNQGHRIAFEIKESSKLEVESRGGVFTRLAGGSLHTRGAMLLDSSSGRVVIGNLMIAADSNGALAVKSTLEPDGTTRTVFELETVMVELERAGQELRLIGELVISTSWAVALGQPDAAGASVGTVVIEALVQPTGDAEGSEAQGGDDALMGGGGNDPRLAQPDVIVADLPSIYRYGSQDGITALAVGTTSCNVGTARLIWISYTNQHPVIMQDAFRLMDDRFEQIGLAWLKHGFYAVSGSYCLPCNDPTDGTELGVGCSDPYSATLNGVQSNMSPRSIVNAQNGYFPYPWYLPGAESMLARRLQIHDADLDPALNPGARYFVQGHYITSDEPPANTDKNNASYREVFRTTPAGGFGLTVNSSWPTQIGQPAVRAWKDADDTVEEVDIQIPGEGIFILAAKATFLEPDSWRYSYALQNLNSDRSGGSFSVALPEGTAVLNVGFHDVDYHSDGEPYDSTDWTAEVESGSIRWFTESYATNENANALRYSTVYSFYFDSTSGPGPVTVMLGLFKPGIPASVTAESIAPATMVDCNGNGIGDGSDILGGTSEDCNTNGIPDECDIEDATSPDVNGDDIPDECQIPDQPQLPPALEHQGPKHRYLSIDSTTGGVTAAALRVDLISMKRCSGRPGRACTGHADCEAALPGSGTCVEHEDVGTAGPWWVQAPQQEPLGCLPDNICGNNDWFARMDATPHYDIWNLDTLHIGDCEVLPVAVYEIRACLAPNGLVCGDPLTIGTVAPSFVAPGFRGSFGDVVGPVDPGTLQFNTPDGITNVNDISGYVLTSQNYGTGNLPQTHPTWVDLHGLGDGNPPNYILNVGDLGQIIAAKLGGEWTDDPGNSTPGQCP